MITACPGRIGAAGIPIRAALASGALQHARALLEGLEVDPARMRANLELTRGMIAAEAVMMALAPHLGRQEAHHVVADACCAAAADGHSFEERQLAAGALLVEAARLDDGFSAAERRTVERLLRTRFGMSEEEAADLLAEAEQSAAESVQLQGFTRAIKDGFDYQERIELIEMLWEVVYTDGALHDHEASLLRRVTGLLYVADRDSGEARKRVLDRLGLA